MLLATLAVAFVGCAAQTPPPAQTPDETTLASGEVTTEDAEADVIVENPSPPEPGQPPIEPSPITEPVEPEAPADEDAPRELLYRVQPDGLLINYDGLKMRPRAQAERLSNGGYGITLTVTLEPSDETDKELLLSDGSPLSVYAKIYDKAGRQKGSLPDVMGAAETQSVCAECDAQPWEATWPAAGTTPLWWGERVVLEVGLWGIGDDSKDRRPMKRLFVVEYKAGGRTDPIVRPPEF